MIFTPYSDEIAVINMIHQFNNEEYALLRMTFTMIDKNNLDANGILRGLLYYWGIVDYTHLAHGGQYGIVHDALFIQSGKTENVKLKFYRVANHRGDPRFSIETLKNRMMQYEINDGDLLYISAFHKPDGTAQVYFVNLTHNTPTQSELINIIGVDAITDLLYQLKPRLRQIVNVGFHNNSKGYGTIAPKDVGDTLEDLLGIRTNNRHDADYNGLIEIKSKGNSRTLDTLFTLRPNFENTRVAVYEPNDKNRVSAFTRFYGYDSDRHPGYSSLYITIGSYNSPQNKQGFYLDVNDEQCRVNLVWVDPRTNRPEIAAFWFFDELRRQLLLKHPSTLWVKAEIRDCNGQIQFKYNEFEFSRAPQFTTFLSLIKIGVITYDWRGYTSTTGSYSGKNHGNAWRIKPNAKSQLFGIIERLDL